MTLGELIDRLRKEPPGKILPLGLGRPHSYRGYYQDLAFQPAENVAVGSMLALAEQQVGATHEGYKGGDYEMGTWTDCWLAKYGECGETIGPVLLDRLLAAAWTPFFSESFPPSNRLLLVTTNPEARDAHGEISHLWLVSIVHFEEGGEVTSFDEAGRWLRNLTHWRLAIPEGEVGHG